MRLLELTGYRQYQDMNRFDLVHTILKPRGFTMLDSGKYSEVWHRDGDAYLYKIYDQDLCYDEFLKYAENHPNPHYPKVYWRKSLRAFWSRYETDLDERLIIVKLEYLPHALPDNIWNPLNYLVNQGVFKQKDQKQLPDDVREMMIAVQHAWYLATEGAGCSIDAHHANVRQRDDGTIVIIDPVWEGESPYQAHDRARAAEIDYDEPDTITGPAWKVHKADNERKQEYARQRAEWDAKSDPDEIPF